MFSLLRKFYDVNGHKVQVDTYLDANNVTHYLDDSVKCNTCSISYNVARFIELMSVTNSQRCTIDGCQIDFIYSTNILRI